MKSAPENESCPVSVPSLLSGISSSFSSKGADVTITLKPNQMVNQPVFIRNSLTIVGESYPDDVSHVQWMTVSQTKLKLKDLTMQGLIQVTAHGKISAENCTFIPANNNSDCAIEVFAQSKAKFTKCIFKNSSKAALLIRDRSRVKIIDCTFIINPTSSLLIIDSSFGQIKNSVFQDSQKFAVYILRNSQVECSECKFTNNPGKSLFALNKAKATLKSCEFSNCMQGAISVADGTELNISECSFSKIRMPSVHLIQKCKAEVSNCTFQNGGVNFEHSTGSVENCTFKDLNSPALICCGPAATPIIKNCTVNTSRNFAVVIRDCSRPSIFNVTFSQGKSHAFSISDFAQPRIANCSISKYDRAAFSVTNGAFPEINGCTISECHDAFSIATFAHPLIINNVINGIITVHHRGVLLQNDFIGNVIKEQDTFALSYQSDKLVKGSICQDPPQAAEPVGLTPINPEDIKLSTDELDFSQSQQLCMLCGKEQACVVCAPCGHMVVCQKCKDEWQATPKEKKTPLICPLCQTGVVALSQIFYSESCVICFEKANTIVLPCGHRSLCYQDAIKSWESGQKCPECRAKMLSFRHYFPTE